MPQVSISGADPYCTGTEFQDRFDNRVLGDWASNTGTRVTAALLPTNAKVQAALASASGLVEAAALRGGKYTTADLAALTGNTMAMLKSIVAGVAIGELGAHRLTESKAALAAAERAQAFLELLNAGERIFATQESADAGRPEQDQMTPAEIDRRWSMVRQYDRLFGRTSDQTLNPFGP